jgi:hypothetical protein
MTQRERDRLVVLKKAQKRLITQRQAAVELQLTERQVRRLLRKLKEAGDKAVMHGLRGRLSHRKIGEGRKSKIIQILSAEVYRGFGPTLASEYLAKKHQIRIGREALRQIMKSAGLWRSRRRHVEETHPWRRRRSCRGELLQWDTSTHDWLERRGETIYLIHLIDDATSQLTARFVNSDSTEENMRLLWNYLERHGRPAAVYTDKASLFQTTPKGSRHPNAIPIDEREPLPATQIGRALRELGMSWIAAHSPQAKGRVERSFQTAQDRLVKGLRVAKAKTLAAANRYLDEEFLPWWNQHLTVLPANPADAHRPLESTHDLAASLSLVETRQVANDYTLRVDGQMYQIAKTDIRTGLRGGTVRIEKRLDGSLAVRFQERYLTIAACAPALKAQSKPATPRRTPKRPATSSAWMKTFDLHAGPSLADLERSGRLDRL